MEQRLEPAEIPEPTPKQPGAPKAAYEREEQMTHEEFLHAVLGKDAQGVVDAVGKPRKTAQSPPYVFWFYNHFTVERITGNVDDTAQVVFMNGKVLTANFSKIQQ